MKIVAFFVVIFCTAHTRLGAQDFEVAPVRVTFNANPGETQTRTVTIKNHSNRRESITLRLHDFLIQRQGEMETLPAGSTRNSIAQWLNISPSFVELEPNETRTIQLNLQAPNDDYASKWGLLSFITTAEQTAFSADRSLQTGLNMAGRIDIFLAYNPASSETGRIEINQLQEIESQNTDEIRFSVNLDNIGERIVVGKLFIIASNIISATEERFRSIEVVTYPQTSRTVELSIPNTLAPGQYSIAAILDYPGSTSLKGTQIMIDVK